MHCRCPHCHNPVEIVDDNLTDITCPSCGSGFHLVSGDSSTRTFAHEHRSIAHFELLSKAGVGTFGTVWKARDTNLDRIVAVKIPRVEALSESQQSQFFKEARAAAQIKHPGIVSVHEVGRTDDEIFIVSDYIEGATLSEWIKSKPLSVRDAAKLCATIADALHAAHEAGVVHRDLKPANIMMDLEGKPHVGDFGLAKRDAGEITMTIDGQILGTPAYMSPEQAKGEGHLADRRSDVYSLGVILYQLLTRELPFRGEARMLIVQILQDDPKPPRELSSQVPRDMETICLKCLQRDPSKRYQTARDFAEDLRHWLDGCPIKARPISRLERLWRWSGTNATQLAGLFSISQGLLQGAAVFDYDYEPPQNKAALLLVTVIAAIPIAMPVYFGVRTLQEKALAPWVAYVWYASLTLLFLLLVISVTWLAPEPNSSLVHFFGDVGLVVGYTLGAALFGRLLLQRHATSSSPDRAILVWKLILVPCIVWGVLLILFVAIAILVGLFIQEP